jgi:lipid-A-disaccharide synthase
VRRLPDLFPNQGPRKLTSEPRDATSFFRENIAGLCVPSLRASRDPARPANFGTLTPRNILLIAGEPSGDQLAAELVRALLRQARPEAPRFFGAGGPAMAAAGVEILHDLTRQSVIGPADALRQYGKFRHAFDALLQTASERTPDVVIGIDFGAFNLRFARAVKRLAESRCGPFQNWRPKIVQFVSPQVWASRPGRARQIARTHDLLLSILPFEERWYAENAPDVTVCFVGHPLVDRHGVPKPEILSRPPGVPPRLVLLPGSRPAELRRHWPVVAAAAVRVREVIGAEVILVLPSENARASIPADVRVPEALRIRIGGLADELSRADVAIASTGTVTLECAWFGVPTVALYKTSWSTYQIGKRIINVRFLAMPNLLAGREVIPEFVQDAATPTAVADATIRLLRDESARVTATNGFNGIRPLLGSPGACERAATAILELFREGDGSASQSTSATGT